MEADRRWRRPAVTVPAVLVLLALVALATARHSWSQSSGGTRHVPPTLWDWVASAAFVLWLVAAGFAFRQYERMRRELGRTRGPVPWWKAALVFTSILLASLLVARAHALHRLQTLHPRGAAPPAATSPGSHARPAPRRHSHFRWEAAAGTAALLAVVGGGYLLLQRRRRIRPAQTRDVAALLGILDDTLDDLRRETDPRKAVIAAYARMERSLAAFGLPRAESEAPEEYLERVLVELEASGASAQRLTALFARAKFSPHTIGAAMKDEAIDALVTLRAELAEQVE